jgi:serine/threonine-protein kinase
MSFEIGDKAGDYEVIGVLGSGGMGTVYRVRNTLTDRFEALKVVLPNMTHEPLLAERFQREIRVQASLDHPNIAALRTAFRMDNRLLMIMELVEGATLDELMARGPIAIGEGVGYIRQALAALAYAHERGVIHRDIKPGNIMVRPDGTVKLLDFGIARAQVDLKLTSTGMALGSPYYMAPEILKNISTDVRSDLYSIGVALYELVTGKRPIDGDGPYAIMMGHLTAEPAPPEQVNPKVPPALSRIILKAMAKEPADRFQSANEFLEALSLSLTGERPLIDAPAPVLPSVPPPRQARVWVVGAIAAAAVLAAGITVWRQRPAPAPPLAGAAVPAAPQPEARRTSQPDVPAAPKSAPAREPRTEGDRRPATPPALTLTLALPPAQPAAAVAPPVVVSSPPERPRSEPPKPEAQVPVAPPKPAPPPAQPDPRALMEEEWARAGAASNPAALDAFRRKYPQSPYVPQAAARIEQMERESARRDILGVVRRYQAAFEGRDLDSIRSVWPGLSREQLHSLEENFKMTRSLSMTLRPAGDPEIQGDSASVSCQRTITAHFRGENRSRKPAEHQVVIRLKRSANAWVIESIQ